VTKKWVYLSRSASEELAQTLGHEPDLAEMKVIFGGKGAGLANMTGTKLPVPPAFTITTEACVEYMQSGEFPEGMWEQTVEALKDIEAQTGKKFGDPANPLLVSVRSGARQSMPGMMDTVLNLGLNDETRATLAELTGNEWFSYDAYRRFITMFSDIVMGYPREHFEQKLEELKKREGVRTDTEVSLEGMKGLVEEYKAMYKARFGEDFPTDPYKQLELAIKAVFDSWNGARAVAYREHQGIPHDWGTAVNVQTMVFGNMGNDSATGVAFSRDPATGKHEYLYGEFLSNAQGEDVVAGIRTPQRITLADSRNWAESQGVSEKDRATLYPSLEETMPEMYHQFLDIVDTLEHYYRDMQDMEFTIERGKLWMLQTRTGKRTAAAAVRIAVDLANEGMIDKEEAIMRVDPTYVDLLLRPSFDPQVEKKLIAKGLNASPGAAVGVAVFDAARAQELAGEGKNIILVRPETAPDDVPGMLVSKGVLTQKGGATSHAAVVARGNNLPCVAGCEEISVDVARRQFAAGNVVIKEGDIISIDGFNGEVYTGSVPMIEAEYEKQTALLTLLEWADEIRTLGVRTNADLPQDAQRAVAFGAEGIGLCRTEHMFFDERARDAVVRMIMAGDDKEKRHAALDEMLPFQEQDFEGVFEAMDGKPVIMRLIDPPMHEFLPPREELIEKVATLKCTDPDSPELAEKEKMLKVVTAQWEVNPMMGLRGCRAGEIEYMFGTMIEVPRAALTAGEIAEYAQFFSFGTNDLTQMTFGYSRDDAEGKFLLKYVEGFDTGEVDANGEPVLTPILEANPFQTLDQAGVGRLVQMCVEEGKAAKPELEIGICGEHGGDPDSIDFCHRVGLDYVSCSPYRVPVARLAAAQATIRHSK